jgi:ABC-type multidrug transport system fused ATPase/permease subunit
MSRINGAIINLKSNKYLIEAVEWGTQASNTVESYDEVIKDDVKIDIDVQNLSFAYDIDNPLISNLTCSFNAGKIHAIVGASGNGKSTLLNLLLGLHHPQEGTITISSNHPSKRLLGQDISPFNWLTQCGYLSQSPFLFYGTVRQNLTLNVSGRIIDETHALRLIHRLKMTDCLGEAPLDFQLFEGGSNLSGGQRQRLALIRALIYGRPVLILDEATSALDSSMRDEVFQILEEEAQRGVNVITVSHDNELVQRCDTLLDLNDHDVFK